MDPQANIERQRELAATIIQMEDEGSPEGAMEYGPELAELVIALDGWRTNGGFDPYGGKS